MRNETVIKTYKTFEELDEEEKKNEIKKVYKNKNNELEHFFEFASIIYDEEIMYIFDEILDDKNFCFRGDRKKLHWGSGSQGWYYERGFKECITIEQEFKKGKYIFDPSGISLYCISTWQEILYDSNFYYKGEYIDFNEIKKNSVKKAFMKKAILMYNQLEIYRKEIEKAIKWYVDYYPTEKDISEDFIANDIEFLVNEEKIA